MNELLEASPAASQQGSRVVHVGGARQMLVTSCGSMKAPSRTLRLGYNAAYHLHCELTLTTGKVARTMWLEELHQEKLHCELASIDERHLTLNELHQWMTYEGLLEGIPDRETNDWRIEQHVQRAAPYGALGSRTILIQPARRDFLRRPGDMEPLKRYVPHKEPEWLPVVTCVGIFRHVPPTRSHLVVVWYQDEFAFPLDDGVLSQLRAITLDATGSSLSGSERVT